MAEIGIKRLGAGDGEKHGAERIKSDDAVVEQKRNAVQRIERPEHAGIARDRASRPGIAIATNHTAVIGPKSAATFAVPRDWNANSTIRMTTVIGTTKSWNAGMATSIPSTAEKTDNAGVMTASP